MKTALFSFLLAGISHAGFEQWTNKDGKTAELELVEVTGESGMKSGTFRMRSGRTVKISSDRLSEEDAKRLEEWKEQAPAAPEASSVFDKVLDGNLVKLNGKSLKSFKDMKKPEKYYLFYYTASWCGPCQKFTPSLVTFYNEKKNDAFEVILISSDREEGAMEKYAQDKEMPWPQLKLSKVDKFEKEFKHPGRGIPNLVLCDLQGNLIKTSYEGENYIGPTAVMRHLETLLAE